MRHRQMAIRKELIEVEKKCNEYADWLSTMAAKDSYWFEGAIDLYHFFQSRRRFFLKDLLKVQIREFDRG